MIRFLTQFSRVFVGVLFIISGLIKSNDPIGFGYKLEEYFQVFNTDFLIPLALPLAVFICAFEIVLGIALLIGYQVRLTLGFLLAMIVFFTFLTFYSAYYNKVTDCGCFGDALKLTPWQSFTKDVVLLALILILVVGWKYIKPVFSSKINRWVIVASVVVNIAFPVYTINYLPIIDFRPYKVGTHILQAMQGGRMPEVEIKMLYKNLKTNTIEKFELDKIPYKDDTSYTVDPTLWAFVDQEQTILDPGEPAPIHDFSISTPEGSEYTQDILEQEGYYFFIVTYDLDKTRTGKQKKINEFYRQCEDLKLPVYGLTSSTTKRIDEFRHEHQVMYDYYITDATQLKTFIRSNPGLVLMKGDEVMGMWSYMSWPELSAVKSKFGF